MKMILSFLVLVFCTAHQVTSLGHRNDLESWKTYPLHVIQNSNVRNPLLLGSTASLTVLDKLQSIRNKLEEIEKKNDHPVANPVRDPENQYQSINSYVDDLKANSDNEEEGNTFEIRPFSLLEKIHAPSSLNGYFMMFRLKQNVSHLAPAKSQSRFIGNAQQHFIQQISTQKPEPAVSQQQHFTVTSQQQSLNNQQMHIRRLNIQEQSTNHDSPNGQQNLVNQPPMVDNRGHHLSEVQKSINQRQPVRDQRSPVHSQEYNSNEGRAINGQQNMAGRAADEKTTNDQNQSVRNQPQNVHQQSPSNTQQVSGQQGILSINHQSTINQYIRPQGRTSERIVSNLAVTENPTNGAHSFEYPSGRQIQDFANELLTKIRTRAMNGESQPDFIDNINKKLEGETSHEASLMTDLEITPAMPVVGNAGESQIVHETRLSTGASVKQHLKTPYATYDFTHLL